jgi:hypothetical protein
MHVHPEPPRDLHQLEQEDISQQEMIVRDKFSPATGNPPHIPSTTVTTRNMQNGVPLLALATLQLKYQILGC